MNARMPVSPTGALLLAAALGACGAPLEPAAERTATRHQEIRPTDGTGWNGNGYGIPAEVYDPPGNHFRVHYVTSGDNAVDLTDTSPMNGVPDFVEQVGQAAEDTYQSTVVRRGFRPPLDDSVYHDRPDYGGDGRFDIYLRWAGTGSDGYRVTEVCTDGTDGTAPGRCAGYFVMNPSYKDGHYPSELDGIRVLTSHELFHTVQDAYNHEQWRTFSEGTAVWNELQVFPDSAATFADYRGFLDAFFTQPERPFDKSMGTGGAASYAYGTAVWAEFLSERFGPQLIREVWEGCEETPAGDVPSFLDATDAALRKGYAATLASAWTELTRWNLYTAERARAGFGYRRAGDYPGVRFETDVPPTVQATRAEVNGLSARYLRFTLVAAGTYRVTVTDPAAPSAVAAIATQPSGAPPTAAREYAGAPLDVRVEAGESLLVVLTGAVRGAPARMVEVRVDPAPPPVPPQPPSPDSGCSSTAGAGHGSAGSGGLGGLLLAAAALVRRRRRTDRQATA